MNFTISIGKYRFSIINCFAFAGSLFMILAFFSKLPQYNIDFFFSSDCLYLPSVYKDLFLDGNHLKDWSLNPSPNFFPDMALYFALMFICKNSFIVSSFIYAILQYATILGLTIFLFKKILPKQSPHWAALIVLLYTLFLTEYLCFTKEYFYSFYLLSNAYHTGSFVMTLLCFYCSVKYYQTQLYRHMIFILTFGIISVLSDRLFIVLYAIPAFTSGFFLVKRVPLKYIIWHWITIIVLVLLGMTAFTVLGADSRP